MNRRRYLRHEDFELNKMFLNELRDHKNDIGHMYYTLFVTLDPETLNKELSYINDLRLGTDKYYGEDSIDNWFAIFHKAVRQADYFNGIVIRKEMRLLDDDELREMKHLFGLILDKKIEKYNEDGSCTDQYRRYLELHQIKRREITEEDISGKFDSLLHSLIHLDKDDVLYKTFELVFEKHRINNLKLELEKELPK